MTLFGISFPCWTCVGCRMTVEWEDAICVTDEDGKFMGVECEGCHDLESVSADADR